MKRIVLLSLGLFAMTACNNQKNDATQQINEQKTAEMQQQTDTPNENDVWSFIQQNDWKLIMLNGVNKDYENAGIKFNLEDNSVSGNTGCNSFTSGFTVENDTISFGEMATTKMLCEEEANQTEMAFIEILSGKKLRFDVADQTLNLYDGDKTVMMFGVVK